MTRPTQPPPWESLSRYTPRCSQKFTGFDPDCCCPEDARFRVPAHFGPVPKHAERIDQARHFGGLRRCQFVLGDHRRIVLDAAEGINTSTYPDERARQAIYAVEPIP